MEYQPEENIKIGHLLSVRFLDRIEDELENNSTGVPFEFLPAHDKANMANSLREALPILIREYRLLKGLPLRSRPGTVG